MKLTRKQINARHREKHRACIMRYCVGSLLCSVCEQVKPVTDFNKDTGDKRGFRRNCRECQRRADRAHYVKNAEKIRLRVIAYRKAYPMRVRESKRAAMLRRRRVDPGYRIENSLRARLRGALKGRVKSAATVTLLGCSVEHLIAHLTSLLQPGMSWANYGSYWEVDHVLPCSSFDLTNADQQQRCFSWRNLQPLTKVANKQKWARV